MKNLDIKLEVCLDVLQSGSGLGGKHLANCWGSAMKKTPNSFLSLKTYQNFLYMKTSIYYEILSAAWFKAVPLPAQSQDLLPCWTHRSLGGPKPVASCSAGVHGLPSTLIKEQREKAVLIKMLGIFTQTFTLQLSIAPLKNSLQCVTRNILLCLNV